MWYSSSNAPYHFCHIDSICNPYEYTRYIKSTWASYGNATGVGTEVGLGSGDIVLGGDPFSRLATIDMGGKVRAAIYFWVPNPHQTQC